MLAQPYDWILRCSTEVLLILIFVFILLRPLWKLIQGRHSLIIVFSKAIASLLKLLIVEMPNFLTNYILNYSPYLYIFFTNGILYTMETVLTTHILALATSRAHAMIFPFHYNSFSKKKRNFYAICALLWIFSICIGFLHSAVRGSAYFLWLYPIVQQICMACAALCYGIIGCKMFWMKYWSGASGSSGAQTEKDSLKIMLICFTSLIMASLRTIILNPIVPMAQYSWPDVPKTIFYWLTFASVLLGLSAEELCMLFLLRDYRRNVAEQICGLIGKKSPSVASVAPSISSTTNVPLFKRMTVIVNGAAHPCRIR